MYCGFKSTHQLKHYQVECQNKEDVKSIIFERPVRLSKIDVAISPGISPA